MSNILMSDDLGVHSEDQTSTVVPFTVLLLTTPVVSYRSFTQLSNYFAQFQYLSIHSIYSRNLETCVVYKIKGAFEREVYRVATF